MSHDVKFLPRHGQEIAIVGMAGRFPGAASVAEFWRNLCDGRESITFFEEQDVLSAGVAPAVAHRENYIRARGVLEGVEYFDATFFGYSPREAEILDPQQRLFLETAWQALEEAGCDPATCADAVGVYAGVGFNSYLLIKLAAQSDFLSDENSLQTLLGNDKDYVATRVSYKLNLRGPALTVQCACSTSLVAVHLACQGLLAGECDLALAGGVSIRVPQETGYLHQPGSIYSTDGHCRAFDAKAMGTVGGNGVAVVALKRLEDALADGSHVVAVIKGSAINNDGSGKAGFTASSVEGQARVIRAAQAMAEVEPATLHFVEGHGSGTSIGDPIEVAALTKVFRASTERSGFCVLGSLKTNVGHLDTAAGVSGLIKAALTVREGRIPPTANFEEPNPRIGFEQTPFLVNDRALPWPEVPYSRRAAVSSFGIGGTNAHAILEQPPAPRETTPGRRYQLFTLSARSEAALARQTDNFIAHLAEHADQDPADVAFTLHLGRHAFEQRLALVARDREDALAALRERDPKRVFIGQHMGPLPKMTFLFSGQGSQHAGMGRELYEVEPTFRETFESCAELLRPELGLDLRALLYPREGEEAGATERLTQTGLTQPALFALEYSLARTLMAWGVEPQAMAGHSVGEYVAACLAGVFGLPDALRLVAARGRLMQQLPPGAMLSVALPAIEVRRFLGSDLDLAASNAPNASVVAGPHEAVERLEQKLSERKVPCRRLHTSHAFHSAMMEPAARELAEVLRGVALAAPRLPYVSNLTGTWIEAADATTPDYWCRHLRHTVLFAESMQTLAAERYRVYLELGPGQALSTLARQNLGSDTRSVVLPTLPPPTDAQPALQHLLTTLGRTWLTGFRPDWEKFHAGEVRRRVTLPTYPFERQRYWVEGDITTAALAASITDTPALESASVAPEPAAKVDVPRLHPRPKLQNAYCGPTSQLEWAIASIWQELFGIDKIGIHDNFFEFGGDSMLAIQLVVRLREHFEVELPFAEVLERPTVAEQAASVEAARSGVVRTRRSPIVRVQPNGERPVFFCVHPAGGIVHCYIDLARFAGKDQPFYALQHPGIDGDVGDCIEFEPTAARYIEAIREVQPEGPYFIGGWSFGGTVAYEIGVQLALAGQEIALLALLDSPGPDALNGDRLRPAFDDAGIFTFLSRGVSGIFQNKIDINYAEFSHLDPEAQFNYILSNAGRVTDTRSLDSGRKELGRIIDLFKVSDVAERNYRPRRFPGRLTMFRVREIDDYEYTGYKAHPELSNPTFGWDKLADGGVDVHFIPGTHMTMVARPNVQVLGQKLRAVLDRAIADVAVA